MPPYTMVSPECEGIAIGVFLPSESNWGLQKHTIIPTLDVLRVADAVDESNSHTLDLR
jgi:hypothetical protein